MKKLILLFVFAFASIFALAQCGTPGNPPCDPGDPCYYKSWDLSGPTGSQSNTTLNYTVAPPSSSDLVEPNTAVIRVTLVSGLKAKVNGVTLNASESTTFNGSYSSCTENPSIGYSLTFLTLSNGVPYGRSFKIELISVTASHTLGSSLVANISY